jgi:membrane protein
MQYSRILPWLKKSVLEFFDDNCSHMAAAVAYYALFSMFPLALALIAIAGFFLGSDMLQEQLVAQMGEFLPVSQDFVVTTIEGVVFARGAIGVVAILGLIWSGSAVFGALRRSLNAAWDIETSRTFLRQKLTEFVMMGWVALLITLSIASTAGITLVRNFEIPILGLRPLDWGPLWGLVAMVLPLFFTFLTFLFLYHYVPNVPTRWREIWPGALIGAILFEAGKNVFVWYLSGFANYNAVYGPLATVVALLFWAYISAAILLLGAELASEYPRVVLAPQAAEESPKRARPKFNVFFMLTGIATLTLIGIDTIRRLGGRDN